MNKTKLYFAFAALALFSCDKKTDDATPSVTFSSVNAILTANCQPCHAVGGGANFEQRAKFVDNYNIAKNVASGMINRINLSSDAAGFMPKGRTKLSAENIQTIQDWIDGGLKEN